MFINTRARLIAAHRESVALCCTHCVVPMGPGGDSIQIGPPHTRNQRLFRLSFLNFFSALLLCQCIEKFKSESNKKENLLYDRNERAARVKVLKKKERKRRVNWMEKKERKISYTMQYAKPEYIRRYIGRSSSSVKTTCLAFSAPLAETRWNLIEKKDQNSFFCLFF